MNNKLSDKTVRIAVRVPSNWIALILERAKTKKVSVAVREAINMFAFSNTDVHDKLRTETLSPENRVVSAFISPPDMLVSYAREILEEHKATPIRAVSSPHMRQHGHDPCWVTKGEKHHQCLKCCTCGKK